MTHVQRLDLRWKNSGISCHYVPDWNLKHAFRELIQNAIDGMVTHIIAKGGSKSDMSCILKAVNNPIHQYRNYDFTYHTQSGNQLLCGTIRYNPIDKELVISNPGTVSRFNLLLGGSGKEINNPQIIGHFGEGMKLAALALCRIEHGLEIETHGDKWYFSMKNDRDFINAEGNPESCLFYMIEPHDDEGEADNSNNNSNASNDHSTNEHRDNAWTYTTITNVSVADWTENVRHFTIFETEQELIEVDTSDTCAFKGKLLMAPGMKGRFFVKDLHIQDFGFWDNDEKTETINADQLTTFYGFNVAECPLNRDRQSIPNVWDRYRRTSCMMADIMVNREHNKVTYPLARNYVKQMKTIVYKMLMNNRHESYYFYEYANREVADLFWQLWSLKQPQQSTKHPVDTGAALKIEKFLRENRLSSQFYPYVVIPWEMYHVLKKSQYYTHWTQQLTDLKDNAPVYEAQTFTENEIRVKNAVVVQIQRIKPDFNENQLIFKTAPMTELLSFAADNKLYLAKELLANEVSLLCKCLHLLRVSTGQLLDCFANINNNNNSN